MGASLTSTPFTAIYASDLKRAASTAAAVSAAQPSSTPAVQHSTLVREQHFGIAEGHPWSADTPSGSETDEELWARGIFPVLSDRRAKFPSGESLDDVRARTDRAVEELLMPHMCRAAREGKRGVHVAVVSHGLCISELVPALLARGVGAPKGQRYSGLRNTAWTRVAVDVKVSTARRSRAEERRCVNNLIGCAGGRGHRVSQRRSSAVSNARDRRESP